MARCDKCIDLWTASCTSCKYSNQYGKPITKIPNPLESVKVIKSLESYDLRSIRIF